VSAGRYDGDRLSDLVTVYNYGAGAAGVWIFGGTNGRGDSAATRYRTWYTAPGHWTVPAAKVAG